MSSYSIKLTNISKRYTLLNNKPTLAENIFYGSSSEEFWALKDINLAIGKGENIGIIGPNGSGKTTLLEIIAGITTPTRGKVQVKGKIASLIELEAGFHPELTGRENININGMLIGMSKKELRERFQEIIDFADIGQFINAPLYTYSLGMKLRLGFAIAINSDPDILLLDEGMAVGDEKFQRKCFQATTAFFGQDNTVVMVSHHLDFIKRYSNRIVWLKQGRIKTDSIQTRSTIREYELAQ
ncbi:MAG: hypothetical protein A2785_02600 [Candidatus Chisholmbacteria bacterium RIFCSPHIGHO2_01_FULL_49_18]|uniref:ABC transporter domain-containing protein n=1 Tax=Candidatus Chisholmbacteria bacterium RIFCSPHIGHO2_01_FULL_49_18 TaxID=1797590 RepID=A0A1G1VKW2_9BACT|nr:MAG: hypothetical protein A2785_02600 [Candidatus Chisholmbacteria bacterium RIFCSPHIGHO2_01_FULL_49_18]